MFISYCNVLFVLFNHIRCNKCTDFLYLFLLHVFSFSGKQLKNETKQLGENIEYFLLFCSEIKIYFLNN